MKFSDFILEDLDKPHQWPKKWRRLFVLTLPISGPLWLATLGVIFFACLIIVLILIPIMGIINLWEGSPERRHLERDPHP